MTGLVKGTRLYFYDHCIYKGITLDRMVVIGPRGGRKVYWMPARKRNYLVASWSQTRDQAVKDEIQ